MNFNIELPNYSNKTYLKGDYSEFKYHTQLGVKPARICFLRTTDRSKGGATKLESEYKTDNYPNIGPGHYTPLLPSIREKKVKRRTIVSVVTNEDKESSSDENIITSDSQRARDKAPSNKSDKKLDKNGLMWGRRTEIPRSTNPGPADTPIKRYPENMTFESSKIPFNSTTAVIDTTSITTIAAHSAADVYKHADIFKSSFESKKEFDVPVIICVRSLKDVCNKCKKEISGNYFYIKGSVFLCRACYKMIMNGTSLNEKNKYAAFKQGRYCTRYHSHHRMKGFDRKVPYKKLYRLLTKEAYLNQYTGGRFINEGIPTKKQGKAGGEGSKINESVFSHDTYNIEDICLPTQYKYDNITQLFNRTVGMHKFYETMSGARKECTVCTPAPVVFVPDAYKVSTIVDMAEQHNVEDELLVAL